MRNAAMRIIAGERKGFVLKGPKGDQTRPTLGRVRESLFSILEPGLEDAHVADLYAGAGGLGLEALSRGAASCLFVEKSRLALDALRANIAKLQYEEKTQVVAQDMKQWIKSPTAPAHPLDIVFMDPPYGSPDLADVIAALGSHIPLHSDSVLVVQCSTRDNLLETIGLFHRYRLNKYGDTALHFFSFIPQNSMP